jgi:hypothetical protein
LGNLSASQAAHSSNLVAEDKVHAIQYAMHRPAGNGTRTVAFKSPDAQDLLDAAISQIDLTDLFLNSSRSKWQRARMIQLLVSIFFIGTLSPPCSNVPVRRKEN